MSTGPVIRIGLPYASYGELAKAASRLGASTLISAGSMFRDGKFTPMGAAAWETNASLDSAGFTAMLAGGYKWSVADYVEFVVTNSGDGCMPFPWSWWSAMDYCCEQEIAGDRAEVERRIALTVDSYKETYDEMEWWRDEGVTDVPDPMPILQGRTADDYARCAVELAKVCRDGELPALVGVGSVCRRGLHGPEGLLTVLDRLDRVLPADVRLHLFGVKGELLSHLSRYGDRIASVDSMAWDTRARKTAHEAGISNTVAHRAAHMVRWYHVQQQRLAAPVAQLGFRWTS